MHPEGCQILSDNGVLELFTQLFLSSAGSSTIAYAILRNVARNVCEVPQCSLIVSCLMQDMIHDRQRRCEILDTLIALIETNTGCVQEHDLQGIVLGQLAQENPLLVFLALKLFATCDTHLLRNIYPEILCHIHRILNNPKLLYPEIVESCLSTISVIACQFDIADFIEKIELERFVDEFIALLPKSDEHRSNIAYMVKTVKH